MTEDIGIIDDHHNPFAISSWIEQNLSLTPHRMKQLEELIDAEIEAIKSYPNEGAYPAFIGIRWGFVKVHNGKLKKTEKWENQQLYDGFGRVTNF
jgi:hypothetical protein